MTNRPSAKVSCSGLIGIFSRYTLPFYLELGFSKSEIAAIVKLCGFWGVIAGAGIGGILILRIGIKC